MVKIKKVKKYIKDRFEKFLSIFNNDKQKYSSIPTEDMSKDMSKDNTILYFLKVKNLKDKLSKE